MHGLISCFCMEGQLEACGGGAIIRDLILASNSNENEPGEKARHARRTLQLRQRFNRHAAAPFGGRPGAGAGAAHGI